MAGKKQFDVQVALDAAMIQFWRAGYANTSVDDLSRVTGLNRSSLYSSFGDKDALFLRCLDRYVTRYGERYDAALSSTDKVATALRAFFEVTLQRIADPEVPDGCLIVQSILSTPVLSPGVAERTQEAAALQPSRVLAALRARGLPDPDAELLAAYVTAVNQSLAVMSRTGAGPGQLRAVVDVAMTARTQFPAE